MTCHLTLLLANALSPTTGWAPAGQLARLLVWSSANEKPQETCVHLNSQMGGQRGRGSTDECVSVCVSERVSGSWPEFPNTIETSSLKRLASFELTVGNKSLHKRDQWENLKADKREQKKTQRLTCHAPYLSLIPASSQENLTWLKCCQLKKVSLSF